MASDASALTVADVARRSARVFPERCALDDGTRRLSYAQLETEVQRIAAGLAASGIGRNDVVCAYLPNCIDYVVVVLATARARAVFSPINPRLRVYEVAGLLEQARPQAVFVTSDLAGTLLDAAGRARLGVVRVVCVDVDETSAPGLQGYRQWQRGVGALPVVDASDAFSLLFTSGTTGLPKGALASHRARMTWVLNAIELFGLSADDRYLGTMPLVYSAGLTFTLMHLHVGATVRILERFDPLQFLQIVERERISSALAVPTMLSMVLDARAQAGRHFDLGSLVRVVTCGAPLPAGLRERVIEGLTDGLWDYYGSTESNSMTVLAPGDQLRKPGSVGRPFTGVEICIAATDGRPLAAGKIGEIWCRNPSVMTAYLGRPDETAAAFSGTWYRTGDLGHLDEEGYLHLAGRAGDVVLRGGVNIYPAEIERAVLLHPAVRDCAVLGVPDARWGESVRACVVLHEGQALTLEDLQQHCRHHLASYKQPASLVLLDEIPRTASGKALKSALAGAAAGVA